MTRLVTFGCSLTGGTGVRPDQTWPHKLAGLMSMKYENKGRPGASTKRIWWDIMNYDFQKSDIVVILWTHLDRWCIIKKEHSKKNDDWDVLGKAKLKEFFTKTKKISDVEDFNVWYEKNNKQAYIYYKYFHDDHDMLTQYMMLVNHTHFYLKNKVRKIYHLRASEQEKSTPFNKIQFLPCDINSLRGKYPPASDGWHPGEECYIEFAKQIHEHISNSYVNFNKYL